MGKPDLGCLRPEQVPGVILRGLAALPACTAALAQLPALERVYAEQAEVDGDSVTIERPCPGVEATIVIDFR